MGNSALAAAVPYPRNATRISFLCPNNAVAAIVWPPLFGIFNVRADVDAGYYTDVDAGYYTDVDAGYYTNADAGYYTDVDAAQVIT